MLSDKFHVHLQVQSDFSKAEIEEILFKDYWEDVQDREHLKLVYLEEAHFILNKKLDLNRSNSEKFPDKDHMSDTNIFAENAAIEKTIPLDSKGEQNKVITSLKDKSNKKTYTGWGSEELMRLLSSSGKDTSKSLDEDEIVGVIMAYIKKKNLFKNNKKKSFLCDEKLHLLFVRRKVGCKSIRKFLAVHLAANSVSQDEFFYGSEDDDVPIMKKKPRVDGSEDDDDDGLIMKKKPRNSMDLKIVKRFSQRNKRCFASLNENNIKLIYLRRSLVIDLLNHPDTFDQKVVGCFVRVKNAPIVHKYEMPKNPYQLGLVTGKKKGSIASILSYPRWSSFLNLLSSTEYLY